MTFEEVRFGLAGGDRGLQSPEQADHPAVATGDECGIRAERTGHRRHVDVVSIRILGERRQDPHYRVNLVVHGEVPPDYGGISSEGALPVLVAEQQYRGRALLLILRSEVAAQQWLHAENIEEIPRYDPCLHTLRLAPAEEDKRHVVVLDQAVEAAVLAPNVVHLRNRESRGGKPGRGRLLAQQHDALAIGVGQRLQQDGVHDAEDGGGCTDSQRQGCHGGERVTKVSAHHPQRKARVLMEHREVLSRSRGEDSCDGIAPEPQEAPTSIALRLAVLLAKYLFHFAAKVAAEVARQKAKEQPIHSQSFGISLALHFYFSGLLGRRHERLGRIVELLLVLWRAEVVGLALIHRLQRTRRLGIDFHQAYRAKGVLVRGSALLGVDLI